jgi:hypothetical protein
MFLARINQITVRILQLAGLPFAGHISRSVESRTLGEQLCDGLQGNDSGDITSCAQALPRFTLVT